MITLKMKLSAVTDEESDDQLETLTQEHSQQVELLAQLQSQLSSKSQYDRIQSFIDGIHEEQKVLVTQLSEMERQEDIARAYQSRQNEILEEHINKHFKLVQWKLFRTVNNAGDSFEEPYCECYVNGVAYHSGLNQAARLNAGLDICEALCKYYNVSAPIVIDNSEANLNILETTGQQVRLEVFNSDLSVV